MRLRRRKCEHESLDLERVTLLIPCADCGKTGLELESCIGHLQEALVLLGDAEAEHEMPHMQVQQTAAQGVDHEGDKDQQDEADEEPDDEHEPAGNGGQHDQ